MTFHIVVFLLVFFLILSLARLWHHGWLHLLPSPSQTEAVRTRVHRLLKPRTPLDCPSCRLACTPWPGVRPAPALVRPWSEVKSRRGAPKRIDTQGFACPNRTCLYFGITDAQIHPLVGDGKHGHVERIQTFRCQACRTTFSARRHTPLYRLKTPSQQIAVVLSSLAEGLDLSAAERVFGYRQATITTWLTRAGLHAQSLHERFFRTLHLPYLQLDHCCAPGFGAPPRCCGCGWPLTPAPRSFPCLSLAPEHNTWHISSSTLSDNCWLPAAYRSSPVMA
jgi:hypothetical protein